MPPTSATELTARRLFDSALRGSPDTPPDPDVAAAAERLCGDIIAGLARWFGPYGAHALVSRALATATKSHPPLAALRLEPAPDGGLGGIGQSVREHGAEAATDAIVHLVACLLELLGRLIGDALAANLLEQSLARQDTRAMPDHAPSTADKP